MRKKIFSVLILIALLLNSSLLTIISTAVDEVQEVVQQTTQVEKSQHISIATNYTRLTNKLPNELIITGVLEKDSGDYALYENPTVYFEFPKEVEKVVVNDLKILYDEELKLQDYVIEKNAEGNQVIKVSLSGKQTQYQTDGITKGTNIRIVANVILKQDIKSGLTSIKMKCNDAGTDQAIRIVNATENSILDSVETKEEGTTVYASGLMINTKAILGGKVLKDGDVIHSNEIIKYQVKVTNTTNNAIENVKVLGHIPEGMTYVKYDEEAFSYWADTYTFLTDRPEYNDVNVLFQDDDLQYREDKNLKTNEIDVGTLNSGASATYYYEAEVNKLEEDKEIDTKIDVTIKDEVVSTYNLKNNAKDGVFETRIRTYIDRAGNTENSDKKNNWVYNIIVKNTSEESQDATVKINIPKTLNVKEVYRLVNKGEDFKYTLEDGLLTIKYEGIPANDYRAFSIEAEAVNVITDENCRYEIELYANTEDKNGETIISNQSIAKGGIEAVKITQESPTNGETLNGFDEIEYTFKVENIGYVREEEGGYTDVYFSTNIPKELEVTSVTYNTNEVKTSTIDSKVVYEITPISKYYTKEDLEKINSDDFSEEIRVVNKLILKNGETSTIKIKAKVKSLVGQKDDVTIENVGFVFGDDIETKISSIVQNTLHNNEENTVVVNPGDNKPETPEKPNNPENPTTPTEPTQPTNPSQPTETKKNYSISGKAWVDRNENGRRDEGEEIVSGVGVFLFDVKNNTFLTEENGNVVKTTTDKNGKYSFTKIPEGSYYVVFQYDTDKYGITDYQKTGVVETEDNDAIEKVAKLFGEQRTIGITNTILLTSSKLNIDLGLTENKIFDLKIEQTVQKITVTNSKGTKQYNFNNKLAKVEIHSKQLNGSTIVVDYKIKVTNVGELAGNVYEIIDQIPSGLDFHSELNNGWSKSASYKISNVSYSNKEIKPGESIELTVTLSKKLNDNSAGSYKSIASIGMTDNSRHIEDSNTENNTSEVEVLITVATGVQIAFRIIASILATLILALMIFIIIMRIDKETLKSTLMVLLVLSVSTILLKDLTIRSQAGIVGDVIDWVGDKVDDVKDYISGGGSSGGSGSGTPGDIDTGDGDIDVDYSDPNPGLSKEEQEKIWMQDVMDQYPGADYSGCTTLEEVQERAKVSVQTDYVNAQLAQYGKSIDGCTSTEELERKLDETKREILSENYPQVDFTGVGSYEEALERYNKQCDEQKSNVSSYLSKHPELNAGNVDLNSLDLNALDGLATELDYIDKNYTENKTFHGDPKTHYYTDGNGNKISDAEYYKLSAEEQKECKGHFEKFLDEKGNSVTYCGSPGKAQTSQTELNYVRSKSELNMTTDGNGNVSWTYHVEYQPTEDFCGREVQIMKADLDGNHSSKPLPDGSVPDVDLNNPPDIPTTPDNPPPPDIPNGGKTTLIILKKDADTNEELYEKTDSGYVSEFRFRIPGYAEDFGVGEPIQVDRGKTYTVYEIGSKFGYDIYDSNGNQTDVTDHGDYKTFEISVNEYMSSMTVELRNILTRLKLSGKVWEDIGLGKNGERDNLYTEGDKLLEGIQVLLYRDDELIGEAWTDKNGEYSFGGRNSDLSYTKDTLVVEDLNKYHVQFVYNGMKYSNVELNTHVANGSKAIEGTYNRQNYNNNFATITSNTIKDGSGNSTGVAVGTDNSTRTLSYNSPTAHSSKIIYGDGSIYNGTTFKGFEGELKDKDEKYDAYGYDIYRITADTKVDSDSYRYELEDLLEYDVNNEVYREKEIKNVNLGLYAREQVDLGVDSDVKQLDVSVNNYHHIYTYGALTDADMDEPMDVKLGALKGKYYERKLHQSSIAYAANNGSEANGDVYVDITYKIFMQNKSSSLAATINELVLNYDSQLEFVQYNYEGEGAINGNAQERVLENNANIKEITLNNLESKVINAGTKNVLEVILRAKANVVADILNHEDGLKLDFMAEIKTYSTYEDGAHYASIDSNSAPRNASVQIDGEGQFITDTFENDTTIAPRFVLSKGEQTIISGTVFEDSPIADKLKANERIGDGEYKDSEIGVKDVKVELLLLPSGEYDATSTARDDKYKQTYNVALLYDSNNVDNPSKAQTYTDENGNYSFAGVVAGNYVIRYTYGENVTYVDGSEPRNTTINGTEIKAREYKSTVITSDYIKNGINTTGGTPHLNGDWSWFLNDKEDGKPRYSDAVDDMEYRAHYEETAVLNNSNLNNSEKYAYQNAEAYTPFFKLGVEADDNQNDQATLTTDGKGRLYYEFNIKNADFGIIERPRVDLQVDKQITNVKVTLGNGQVPIDGNPTTENLPYVKRLDDFVPIELDTEIIVGATLKQQYTISVKNNSEIDYPIYNETTKTDVTQSRNYYYYGDVGSYSGDKISTKLDTLVDYLSPELDVNLEEMKANGWEIKEVKDLYVDGRENNLVTEEVKNKLDNGKYQIFTTNIFAQEGENAETDKLLRIGQTKSISYEVSRLLTSKDEMKYTNDVEILQYLGYSQNKDTKDGTYATTPGDLVPEGAKEDDEDSVKTTITPPTGTTTSKIVYITTALTGLMIIVVGVIFIRKRVLV